MKNDVSQWVLSGCALVALGCGQTLPERAIGSSGADGSRPKLGTLSDCTEGFRPRFQDLNVNGTWAEYRVMDEHGNHDWYDASEGDVQVWLEIPSRGCEVVLLEGSWHKNKGSVTGGACPSESVPVGTPVRLRVVSPTGDVAYSELHGWDEEVSGETFGAESCREAGCTSDAECDDGVFCNGAESCQEGSCMGGPAVDCSSLEGACQHGVCDEATGSCVVESDGGGCGGGDEISDCTPGFSPSFQDLNTHDTWAEYRVFDEDGSHDWYVSADGDVQLQLQIPSRGCEVSLAEGSWRVNKGSAATPPCPSGGIAPGTPVRLRVVSPSGQVAYSVEHGWDRDVQGARFAAADCPGGGAPPGDDDPPADDDPPVGDDPPADSDCASRPAYNTGSGFYVCGGQLYDANGVPFRIRGLNKLHWDVASVGIPKTHANTVRYVVDFSRDPNENVALMHRHVLDHGMVAMPGNWDATCERGGTAHKLRAVVDTWIAQRSAWQTIERQMILNIANEWGPARSTEWRDAYIEAIARLRGAGYTATIAVDSGGCGQDLDDLASYAREVFESDPQRNVIFDLHIYGEWTEETNSSWQTNLTQGLNQLSALNLPVVIGEFGPGRGIGPSATQITPETLMAEADARGFGWLAWAWDDPAGEWNPVDDSWFSMSYTGDYQSSADLTIFGKVVVEHPTLGLSARARKATVFP